MSGKIIAIAVVAILIVAGAAAAIIFMGGGEKSDASGLSIVGRVNSEGSGIILNQGEYPIDYITETTIHPGLGAKYIFNEDTDTYYVFNTANWGGKVFATPGMATIQHVQLWDLATMMGLKFVSYTENMKTESDTLYYVAGVPSFAEFENKLKTAPLSGYIIWEAQYSVGIERGYPGLALTNELFNGHTCCIIGASNKYLSTEANTFEVFLSVYSKAVDKINAALADKTSEDYATLLSIATNRVSMPDSLTPQQKEDAIKKALDNVTYLYADDAKGSLVDLTDGISSLAKTLYEAGQIEKSAQDLGFKSYDAMAKKFVNDSYIKKALKGDFEPLTLKKKINVAAISGDIHQIAIWYAMDTKMFDAANLEVNVFPQSNGPGVYVLLANGEADIGFLGAPPMTIRSMNGEDIKA